MCFPQEAWVSARSQRSYDTLGIKGHLTAKLRLLVKKQCFVFGFFFKYNTFCYADIHRGADLTDVNTTGWSKVLLSAPSWGLLLNIKTTVPLPKTEKSV